MRNGDSMEYRTSTTNTGCMGQYATATTHHCSDSSLSGSTVLLTDETVTITGIDEFGSLRVQNEEGHHITVRSDRNTFDIVKGQITKRKAL